MTILANLANLFALFAVGGKVGECICEEEAGVSRVRKEIVMTPFGKLVRHLRIEREMLLGCMADNLAVSAAYASQIETGKRAIPEGYVEKIIGLFSLDENAADALREAALQSARSFNITLPAGAVGADRALARELATEFARLTPEAKLKIQKIVRGEG